MIRDILKAIGIIVGIMLFLLWCIVELSRAK
jgi:hypothetical protein